MSIGLFCAVVAVFVISLRRELSIHGRLRLLEDRMRSIDESLDGLGVYLGRIEDRLDEIEREGGAR